MDVMEESKCLAHPRAGYQLQPVPCSWVVQQGSLHAARQETVVPALRWHAPSQSMAQFIPTLSRGRCGDEGPTSPLWGMVHSAELFWQTCLVGQGQAEQVPVTQQISSLRTQRQQSTERASPAVGRGSVKRKTFIWKDLGMGMVVWVLRYLRNNRTGFCQPFLFLDRDSLVTGHSYSRVLISPPHTSVGTEQSQSCREAKRSISKAAILPIGKAKILTHEKRQDCVHALKGKIQKHCWETPKMLLKSKGGRKSKWEGWPLHWSHLPSSSPAVPGLQHNIWESFPNLRISTAPSCLGKMLKNDEELKDCRIINTCQHGFKKSRSCQTNFSNSLMFLQFGLARMMCRCNTFSLFCSTGSCAA